MDYSEGDMIYGLDSMIIYFDFTGKVSKHYSL